MTNPFHKYRSYSCKQAEMWGSFHVLDANISRLWWNSPLQHLYLRHVTCVVHLHAQPPLLSAIKDTTSIKAGCSSTEQRLEHEFHVCLSSTAERLHFINKSGLTSRKHQRWWSHLFWTTAQWRGKRRREERAFSAFKMETPLWPDRAPAWVMLSVFPKR